MAGAHYARNVSMKLTTFVILATLLIGGGSGCADLHPEKSLVFVPKGKVTNETNFNGFSVKTYRSDDGDGSFEILRENKRIYGQHGYCFFIGGQASNIYKAMRMPTQGADITGNGKPNLVVYEWTGGAHCCYVAYVFELGSSVKMIAEIDGRHSTPGFVDLDGDSVPEVILNDWTFEYWPGCFEMSPAPKVVLHWRNGRYIPDAKLMEIPTPSPQDLSREAESIRNDDAWNDRVFNSREYSRWCIPSQLFQTALDLMYGGHEESGRKFIRMAWSTKYPLDNGLLVEFDKLLSQSPYWTLIKKQRESNESQLVHSETNRISSAAEPSR
jgi:hypothetical protein